MALAWMPKATIRRPGSVYDDAVREHGVSRQADGEKSLQPALLCVLITAPLGAWCIAYYAPKMLTKRRRRTMGRCDARECSVRCWIRYDLEMNTSRASSPSRVDALLGEGGHVEGGERLDLGARAATRDSFETFFQLQHLTMAGLHLQAQVDRLAQKSATTTKSFSAGPERSSPECRCGRRPGTTRWRRRRRRSCSK